MFATTPGELAIVVFIFVLVWGAVLLPRVGERLSVAFHKRVRGRDGG